MKQIYMFFIIAFFVVTITFIAGFFPATAITSYTTMGGASGKTGILYLAAILIFTMTFLFLLAMKYQGYKTKKQNCG
jgi:hypothetical protein